MKAATPLAKAGRTVDEFCKTVSIGKTKAYELMSEGAIKYVKIGRRTVITTDPVAFLENFSSHAGGAQ